MFKIKGHRCSVVEGFTLQQCPRPAVVQSGDVKLCTEHVECYPHFQWEYSEMKQQEQVKDAE